MINDSDEGQLDDKPGEFDRDPDKEAGSEHQLTRGRITNLKEPKAE